MAYRRSAKDGRGIEEVDAPTDEELDKIWEDKENAYISGGSQEHMHIYEDCPRVEFADNNVSEKPINVFPPGYKSLCKFCASEWRDKEKDS